MNATNTAGSPSPTAKPTSWWLLRFGLVAAFFLAGVLLIVLVGLAQRVGWIQAGGGEAGAAASPGEVYTCPMHPQVRQPKPGRCFICKMPLVPLSASSDGDELEITIAPSQRRLANIQTAPARYEAVSFVVRTVGSIEIDESREATIAAYVDGRVERMFADYTGVHVAKGDHLAVVYSPELFAAQAEYVEAKQAFAKMSNQTLEVVRQVQEKLVANSRMKLSEMGMTDEQLRVLDTSGKAESRLTIYAPIGGTVIQKLAEEGKYVSAGEPIYKIANLSTVWLMLELYPEDASRIRFGQRVEGELQSLPGQQLTGRVAFVDPRVDPATRTVGVRVEFDNRDGRLRPGDFAQAKIDVPIGPEGDVYDRELAGKWISPMHPQVISDTPGDCRICGMKLVPTSRYGYSLDPVEPQLALLIPRSAVLMAGQNSVVYVEMEPGRFQIRPITIGSILRDRVIVLGGLKEGEEVATAGNFLIDSQMQLAGKPSLIDPTVAIERINERKTPMEFGPIQIQTIPGETGRGLEQVFAAYLQLQQVLSDDRKPQESDVRSLHGLASTLLEAPEFSDEARELLEDIKKHSEHLHHLGLPKARLDAFRPLSHAMIRLATVARGAEANQPLFHMFCPMVKGGSGDWLQATGKLRNPYFGSEMLFCGELAHEFPLHGSANLSSAGSAAESLKDAPNSQREN